VHLFFAAPGPTASQRVPGFFAVLSPDAQAQVPGLFLKALSHKKIPQAYAVAGYRAFFLGALSDRGTFPKARGCGRFSVKTRQGRK